MLTELTQGDKVVGAKQVRRALKDGRVQKVFLARDAEPRVSQPLIELCREAGVPLEEADSMRQLGTACGISVGAAVAALME